MHEKHGSRTKTAAGINALNLSCSTGKWRSSDAVISAMFLRSLKFSSYFALFFGKINFQLCFYVVIKERNWYSLHIIYLDDT